MDWWSGMLLIQFLRVICQRFILGSFSFRLIKWVHLTKNSKFCFVLVFLSFVCTLRQIASSEDNPLGFNQGCQVFSHSPSLDPVSSRKQLLLMGLCHWLPRSQLQIWGSGLSAKELRASGIQAADRCNMSLVRMVQALRRHELIVLSPRSLTGFSICFHWLVS